MNISEVTNYTLLDRESLLEEVVKMDVQINQKDSQIQELERQLSWFKRQIFGKRSERVVANLNSQQLYFECKQKDAESLSGSFPSCFSGLKHRVCYNSTHGFLSDIFETIAQKIGINTAATTQCLIALRQALQDSGGKMVIATAHSQGGTILAGALKRLRPEERRMIHVATFGSASIIKPQGLASVVNYVSTKDAVPFIADFFGVVAGHFSKSQYVRFINTPGLPLIDHTFEGAYGEAFRQHIDTIIKEHGKR